MFHLLRLHTAFALLASTALIWLSEMPDVRNVLETNTLMSMLQQVRKKYWLVIIVPNRPNLIKNH